MVKNDLKLTCCLQVSNSVLHPAISTLNLELSNLMWIAFASMVAFILTLQFIRPASLFFQQIGRIGVDFGKAERPKIPEGLGIIGGVCYLCVLFVLMPILFLRSDRRLHNDVALQFGSGTLSICCMLFLGFVDDILELRWRYKLIFPLISSIPLVLTYHLTGGITVVVVPTPLKALLGNSVDLGHLYHVYMSTLCVFSTNAINIYSGINGLEVGQSIVIASALLLHNFLQIFFVHDSSLETQIISIYFLLPFLAVSIALFTWNQFPAKIFVGDSYVYFAGITFSCAAVLGHYGKTLILFFVPQIVNFLFSFPQLVGIFPCPRHRMPMLSSDKVNLEPSVFYIKIQNNSSIYLLVSILFKLGLIQVKYVERKKECCIFRITNLTVPNFVLLRLGRMPERNLFFILMLVQLFFSLIGFLIRYFASEVLF